jgi:hypothetical protein
VYLGKDKKESDKFPNTALIKTFDQQIADKEAALGLLCIAKEHLYAFVLVCVTVSIDINSFCRVIVKKPVTQYLIFFA